MRERRRTVEGRNGAASPRSHARAALAAAGFAKGARVSVKPEWRKHYVGMVRGTIIQGTSLGIAVKVRWDESELQTWVAMSALEQEKRR